MSISEIQVIKASEHNLKGITVHIPKNSFTVITGPSGSGKSSLAFDTIFAEGQRRYIESLSSYARQFLGQFAPPQVESIKGLSPTIAIDQKGQSHNPRSTVGTITEIYDYLRVLYARIGTPHCPQCGQMIESQNAEQITKAILRLPVQTKVQILAPIVKGRKGEYREELSQFLTLGFARVRVDGVIYPLGEQIAINKNQKHNIEIVIDRLIIKPEIQSRLNDSVETALKFGKGTLEALITLPGEGEKEQISLFSEKNVCLHCDLSFPELTPQLFSFNSPIGACPQCKGLGEKQDFDLNLLIQDSSLSLHDGAIPLAAKKNSFFYQMLRCVAKSEGVSLDTPLKKLPKSFYNTLILGSDKIYQYSFKSENSTFNFKKAFPGILSWLKRKYNESSSEKVHLELQQYMKIQPCQSCKGGRLNPWASATQIGELTIQQYCDLSIDQALLFLQKLSLPHDHRQIAEKIFKEILERLSFLQNVGLNYLTLNRPSMTLSGGEAQRIRLATQIGASLTGVLYVLDEPSIGLHSKDNSKLIQTLLALRDLGNTVLVVEHDEETIRHADYIIDMGPGAGIHGGEVVAHGTLKDILSHPQSLTAKFLNKEEIIPIPEQSRASSQRLEIIKATQNNIQNLDLTIPLQNFVCITGVSGSGKSTLIHEILVPAIKEKLSKERNKILYRKSNYKELKGYQAIQNVIELDQAPIGRTPKSNPATYSGLFDPIRQLFSQTIEAQTRGYKPGRFSFNVKGGRCEHCEGNGVIKVEMHFLPDVYITCEECSGKRYNQETLSVLFKGKNIAEILDMSVEEALTFFNNHPSIAKTLRTLHSVGLDYMKLGQPATTLSGGEAQRLKLARELAKNAKEHCLYVLDEPTTGLHFRDIKILLKALHQLVDQGHSMIIIEHNLDVIKTADFIIDLGPEGGDQGGKVVTSGTPKEVAETLHSYTGQYLKELLTEAFK